MLPGTTIPRANHQSGGTALIRAVCAQPAADGGVPTWDLEARCPDYAKHGGKGHFPVAVLCSAITIGQATVVFIQHVAQLHIKRQFAAGLPAGPQIQHTVAGQSGCIVSIGIATADRLPAGTNGKVTKLTIHVQVQRALGAVLQGVAIFAVTRVNNAQAQLALPAVEFVLKTGLQTVDTGSVNVAHGAFPGYRITNRSNQAAVVSAIQRSFQLS